ASGSCNDRFIQVSPQLNSGPQRAISKRAYNTIVTPTGAWETYVRRVPRTGQHSAPAGAAEAESGAASGRSEIRFDQALGDLHRVQRGSLADVVRHDPEVQAAGMRDVLADAPDEDLVLAGRVRHRRRVAARLALVDDDDA